MSVVAALGEVLAVPDVAVARGGRSFAFGRHINGQVQRHGAVATCRIAAFEHMSVVAALGEVLAVPDVTVASGGRSFAFGRFVHRQRQHNHAVARARTADCVGIFVNTGGWRQNFKTVFIKILTLTNTCSNIRNRLAANGQVQNHCAVAAVNGLKIQLVVARF